MLRKAYTPLSMFAHTILLVVMGIFLYTKAEFTLDFIRSVMLILAWIVFFDTLLKWLMRRDAHRPSLWMGLFRFGFALFLSVFPNTLAISLSLLFGIWIFLNALGKFLYTIQLINTKSRGAVIVLIQGLAYTFFAFFLLTSPVQGAFSLAEMMGLYCFISSFFYLIDTIREILGSDLNGKRIRQRVRIKPPVLLTALLPMRLLASLDDPDEEAEVALWTRVETQLENAEPNMQIFLHLSKNTAFGFGHVDIAIDDKIYTYGCYDESSNRLFGILSDGVLVEANRDEYIPFCVEREKKRLISYDVVLSEMQKEAIKKKIKEFLLHSTRWYPTAENEAQKALEKRANAVFHKIGKGPFQTYNVLTTNCVAVANMFSGSGGVDLMNPQGIITPGTYAAFLDRQLLRPKSIVVSRTVYR